MSRIWDSMKVQFIDVNEDTVKLNEIESQFQQP